MFKETNLKESTGMRVAWCPCDASSCRIKPRELKLIAIVCFDSLPQCNKSVYLNVRIRSGVSISRFFEEQYVHLARDLDRQKYERIEA